MKITTTFARRSVTTARKCRAPAQRDPGNEDGRRKARSGPQGNGAEL